MSRNIAVLPPELTRVIFAAGDRRVVLVEGKNDKKAFDSWYVGRLSEVEFFDSGGSAQVQDLLPVALAQSTRKRIFGIIDRDWQEESDAIAWKSENDPHLFVLGRYDLENYLLEPEVLHRALRILSNSLAVSVSTSAAIETTLLEISRRLCPILAANWIFHDLGYVGGIDYFNDSYYPADRAVVVRATEAKLNCTYEDAENKISAKEASILPFLSDLEAAHKRIKGKTLLVQFHLQHVKRYLPALESFRNTMVRAVKLSGIPADISEIIEEHILAYT